MLTGTQKGVIINVLKEKQKEVNNVDKVCKSTHPKYYAIPAYIILAQTNYKEIANRLEITEEQLENKIYGQDDFTYYEAILLSDILKQPQEKIFLT